MPILLEADVETCCAIGFILALGGGGMFVKWVLDYYQQERLRQSRQTRRVGAEPPRPVWRPQAGPPAPPRPPARGRPEPAPPPLRAPRNVPARPVFEEEESRPAAVGSLATRHAIEDHLGRSGESEVARHVAEHISQLPAEAIEVEAPRPRRSKRKQERPRGEPKRRGIARIEEDLSPIQRAILWKEILGPPPGLRRVQPGRRAARPG